jgi:cytochrome P450
MTLCRRDFNTADQAFLHNPYPRYALWRQEQPVFWSERFHAWFLLRYADVLEAFRHPKLSNQRVHLYEALPGVALVRSSTLRASPKAWNWLRILGNAEASRIGQGVWQQLHTRAVQSEKWWDSVAEYGAGMRVITAFFCPYAPDALTSHVSVFSHYFKTFKRFTKLATSSIAAAAA